MGEVSTDPGVFIRSMAARGALGGLSLASREVADLMDAFGFDYLLIETVGVERAMMIHTGSRGCRVIGNCLQFGQPEQCSACQRRIVP